MKTAADIERYMLQLGLEFETAADNLWIVQDEGDNLANVIVTLVEPIVIFQVRVANLPGGDQEALFRKLLELNATDMLHGAYGIEGDSLILVDTLQSENLDLNEFQASLEAMSLALIQHYPILKGLLGLGSKASGQEAGR